MRGTGAIPVDLPHTEAAGSPLTSVTQRACSSGPADGLPNQTAEMSAMGHKQTFGDTPSNVRYWG